ncbi:MAG: hypothetical protein WCF36_01730 [Candidatus Nanopelagicales bacterium]
MTGRAQRSAVHWAIWGGLRLLLVAIITGAIAWPEQVNDLNIYADWVRDSLGSGRFPTDQMWQYPPLVGPLFLLGGWLPGERIGFVVLFLAFDALIMAMASVQASRTQRYGGVRLWALLPLLVGPLLLARFDVVPTAFAVAAVLLAGRPALSGALAITGGWLKAWPVLVLAALRRSALPRAAAGALAASVLIAVALTATMTDPWSFLTGQRDRGLQIESVAAWPFLVGRALGAPVEVVYRYGAHEVDAAWVGLVASGATVSTAVLLGIVAVQRLRGALEQIPGADVALAAVLFSVVGSRVFSGQYFIWLLGLATVCLGDPGTRMWRTVALLIGAGAATQLIYPWLYTALLEGNPVAVLVQTIRVGLTLAAAGTALAVLLSHKPTEDALPSRLGWMGR